MKTHSILLSEKEYRFKGNTELIGSFSFTLLLLEDGLDNFVDNVVEIAYEDDRTKFMQYLKDNCSIELEVVFLELSGRLEYPEMHLKELKAVLAITVFEIVQVIRDKALNIIAIKNEVNRLIKPIGAHNC